MVKLSASVSVQYDNVFSPFSGNEWEKGLEWVKSCGFEGAELIVSDPKLVDADKIAAKLEQLGLKASTISTGQAMGIEGLAMTAAAEYLRELTRKRLFAAVDCSVKLGRPTIAVGLIRGLGKYRQCAHRKRSAQAGDDNRCRICFEKRCGSQP